MPRTETEKFVKYGCVADTIAEAFTFVMEHVDKFTRPDITISAISTRDADGTDADWEEKFEVSVYGTVNDA